MINFLIRKVPFIHIKKSEKQENFPLERMPDDLKSLLISFLDNQSFLSMRSTSSGLYNLCNHNFEIQRKDPTISQILNSLVDVFDRAIHGSQRAKALKEVLTAKLEGESIISDNYENLENLIFEFFSSENFIDFIKYKTDSGMINYVSIALAKLSHFLNSYKIERLIREIQLNFNSKNCRKFLPIRYTAQQLFEKVSTLQLAENDQGSHLGLLPNELLKKIAITYLMIK